MKKVAVALVVLTSLSGCGGSEPEVFNPTKLYQCNKEYVKTKMSSNDRGDYQITFSMTDDIFIKRCNSSYSGPGKNACKPYVQCVSQVVSNLNKNNAFQLLSYKDTAKVLRDNDIKSGALKKSTVVPYNTEQTIIENVIEACQAVSSTYSSKVLGASIYKNIPEIENMAIAYKLGEKAVKGLGECLCVLEDHIGLKMKYTLDGYCKGENYYTY
jgi:hypothetical protein